MKAVMYHYVRESQKALPFFRYLSTANFIKQLDYFEEKFGILTLQEFEEYLKGDRNLVSLKNKVLLTFDDGFIDHYETVFFELKKREKLGIFYIPTGVYGREKALDVHRIHYLLGKYGGVNLLESLEKILDKDKVMTKHVDVFHAVTYVSQKNDEATELCKKIFNYYLDEVYREELLDDLFEHYGDDNTKLFKSLYMDRKQIKEMHEGGMVMGSHSVSHNVMSKLTAEAQCFEIESSFQFLDETVGQKRIKTFCYPYGGFHTFTQDTEKILDEVGCQFSFNVESRDVDEKDFRVRKQALPRYDCNYFPFGKASFGSRDV